MSTAFSLMAAGVHLVPAARKVPADPLLLGLMTLFFVYVTYLLWQSDK